MGKSTINLQYFFNYQRVPDMARATQQHLCQIGVLMEANTGWAYCPWNWTWKTSQAFGTLVSFSGPWMPLARVREKHPVVHSMKSTWSKTTSCYPNVFSGRPKSGCWSVDLIEIPWNSNIRRQAPWNRPRSWTPVIIFLQKQAACFSMCFPTRHFSRIEAQNFRKQNTRNSICRSEFWRQTWTRNFSHKATSHAPVPKRSPERVPGDPTWL